ncbi:UNVERIFIED_CONTAM: hypothetical protein HDU68_010440 [Siphonaria sp. JEL0065]|nr:hypothetical protein HDU68_010440 [Siphonaria sp. JEL0065]
MQRLFLRSLSNITRNRTAMYSTTGKFAEKEAAAEAKYVHDHDAELIAKLRKDLAKKTTEQAAAAAALEAAVDAAPKLSPVDAAGLSGHANQSAFAKKEAAAEEKYFRDQDKEKLKKLHK